MLSRIFIVLFVITGASLVGNAVFATSLPGNTPVYEIETVSSLQSEFSDTVFTHKAPLSNGSRVQTEFNEYASIVFGDSSEVYVSPQSDLTIFTDESDLDEVQIRIELTRGSLHIQVNNRMSKSFEVETGSSVAMIQRGHFGVQANGFYWVESGQVEVMLLQTGQVSVLRNGMFAQIDENASDIVTGRLSRMQIDRLNELVRVQTGGALNRSLTSYVIVDEEPEPEEE